MLIYADGKISREEEAVVSVYDHGFLYGIGLFETFRTYGGRPFLLREHLARLMEGCRRLAIAYKPDELEVKVLISRLLELNGLKDAYFRLSLSAGSEALGLPSGVYGNPRMFLYVKPLPPEPISGKSLCLLNTRRNSPEGTVRDKSFHYMNNVLAKRELAGIPGTEGAEGLLLNGDGFLAEGIVSNLFFVKQGVCRTPSVNTGILPGITRAFVQKLLREEGIPCREGRFAWTDLLEAEEAFLTNSIQGLVPVSSLWEGAERVRDFAYGEEREGGPLTARLRKCYRKACETGIR